MKQLDKVVRIGMAQGHGRRESLYCRVEIKEGNLSICGVLGPRISGNAVCCGQIREDARAVDKFAPGWTPEKRDKFCDYWDKWHLNDMRAGCEHQRALGWTKYDEHPSEPCPVCGYKYGSAWLYEELPADVIEFMESLPDADRQPAWV